MPAPNPVTMDVGKLAIDPVRLDGSGQRIGPRLYTLSTDGQVIEFMPGEGTTAPLVSPNRVLSALSAGNLADGFFYEYSGAAGSLNLLIASEVRECMIYTTTNAITFTGNVVNTGSGGLILPGGCVMALKKLLNGTYLLFGDMTT